MPFPTEIKVQAFMASGRACICQKLCGINIDCHHIVPEAQGGSNLFENCIPLCFDCHANVEHYNAHHPKGNKFTSAELRGHRDTWYQTRRETGAPDPSQTVITEDDVLKAFHAIRDFSEEGCDKDY